MQHELKVDVNQQNQKISKQSALDSQIYNHPLVAFFSFCIHAARARSPCNARVLRLIKLAHALLYSSCLARSAVFLIGRDAIITTNYNTWSRYLFLKLQYWNVCFMILINIS